MPIPSVESVPNEVRTVSDVSADTGYFSENAVQKLEWDIVTLAYNFKRLFNMTGGILLSGNGVLKEINL
jgi:hypothetical protein